MSGRVVSDMQNRAEGVKLYVRYNTAAHIVNSTCNTHGCPPNFEYSVFGYLTPYSNSNYAREYSLPTE